MAPKTEEDGGDAMVYDDWETDVLGEDFEATPEELAMEKAAVEAAAAAAVAEAATTMHWAICTWQPASSK